MELLEKIKINKENLIILNHLKVTDHSKLLTPDQNGNWHIDEGLQYFWETSVPKESKYFLNGTGIIVKPNSGLIIAFKFNMHDVGFKHPTPPSKFNVFKRNKIGYFSNFDNSIITDISHLGTDWALGINYVGDWQDLIVNKFNS
jgi:hypothetical protein